MLEYDFRKVTAFDQIHTLYAGSIVLGNLSAFECVDTGAIHMCQESAKGVIMLLFLVATAYLIAVNKAVVRYINFISAIAQTMPND